jgi:hypothetical protein
LARCNGANLRDDVRVALSRQALEEIPAAPEGTNAQQPDYETSDEERSCELRERPCCDDGGRERGSREGELPALFLTKLPKPGVSLIDRSRVHESLLSGLRN